LLVGSRYARVQSQGPCGDRLKWLTPADQAVSVSV
jgi:hypothetical protein